MSAFSELQSALAEWPHGNLPSEPCSDQSLERLRSVLVRMKSHDEIGAGDLAGLIRHVLRRQTVLRETPAQFRVPLGREWPDQELWAESDVDVVTESRDSLVVRAPRAWSADWLSDSHRCPPLVATFAEEPRREIWPVSPRLPIDPALSDGLGLEGRFAAYMSPGQRQAIQAAFFLKPGGTLVVNLPTGSGKSLVAWAPALMTPRGSLSVFVTPTIALALDQERQLRSQYSRRVVAELPDQLAWHSGLSVADRHDIYRRLADGTQRILIASPESLVTSLARPLYTAASTGTLKYFVIDEAHLVAQWGTEFRPEFQSMCGLRRELLGSCPDERSRFRTLLLSATLTQDSLNTLRELYAEDDFDTVSAVSLRPESEYWISNARFESERIKRVSQLLRVVPRPFLLYVTKRDDAEAWAGRIKEMAIRRVGCVHGATPAELRADVVDRWRNSELDCVVATSAFGLGMDKSNVRTVIHACVPESLDRYYQEVGRGGRDGHACVSILVHTEADKDIARSLSSKKVITIEKGLPRWRRMVTDARRDTANERLLLDLSHRPSGVSQATEANLRWNLRTVVLLNKANLIRIESMCPPEVERLPDETDDAFECRRSDVMSRHAVTLPVRIIDDGHQNEAVWAQRVEPVREALLRDGWQNAHVMEQALSGQREISSVLTDTYRLRIDDVLVDPVPVCAGCPACRNDASQEHSFVQPEPEAVTCIEADVSPDLRRRCGINGSVLLVACPANERGPRFVRKLCQFVLRPLVQQGIREIAAPVGWRDDRNLRGLYQYSERQFVIHRDLQDRDRLHTQLAVPRVTLFLHESSDTIPDELIILDRPLHVLFAWEDTPDGHRPESRFFERAVHLQFDDLLRRLNQ